MNEQRNQVFFDKVALIGIGLIGSSVARSLRRHELAGHIAICDINPTHIDQARELDLGHSYHAVIGDAVTDADVVIVCSPVGTYRAVSEGMAPFLKPGAIVTDVGSVKLAATHDLSAHLPDGVHLVPGHPVAGTERSGPKEGFAALFEGRWCILTPPPGCEDRALRRIRRMWRAMGMMVDVMDARHHDKVLAITSHLPHLIAYTIVGTSADLEDDLRAEVIQYSAGGFRDFTRLAGSDPTMWRDVFLSNKEAVLEMLQRFTEDLTALQRAIRWGEADFLQDLFTRTRTVRRDVIEAKQDFPDWLRKVDEEDELDDHEEKS